MSAIAADIPRQSLVPWVLGLVMAMAMLILASRGSVSVEEEGSESFWECEDTHNAASISQANVNTAITAADDGDCVVVPSGSAAWNDLDLQAKDIQLIGASTITCSGTPGASDYACASDATNSAISTSGTAIHLDLEAKQRITGFVISGSEAGYLINCQGNQDATKFFRVDHIALISTDNAWTPQRCFGGDNGVHPQGIWDHNRLQDGIAIHTNGTNEVDLSEPVMNELWAVEPVLGDSDQVVYVEANYFVVQAGDAMINFADGNYGARSVLRYNTMDGPSIAGFEFHSPQGANRGYQRWEAYENHFIDLDDSDTCFWGPLFIRGGTGVAFNNNTSGSISGCNWQYVFDNVRSADDDPIATLDVCDGTSAPSGVDQNTGGQSGWHCRDQVGISHDLTLWDSVSPFGAWNQNVKPAYVWNNQITNSVVAWNVSDLDRNETHIQANRDFYDTDATFDGTTGVGSGVVASRPSTCTAGVGYFATDEEKLYKCTATDTWALYFTPYEYPHPWTN